MARGHGTEHRERAGQESIVADLALKVLDRRLQALPLVDRRFRVIRSNRGGRPGWSCGAAGTCLPRVAAIDLELPAEARPPAEISSSVASFSSALSFSAFSKPDVATSVLPSVALLDSTKLSGSGASARLGALNESPAESKESAQK